MKRIINKETKLFLRDDIVFDETTEEMIDAPPVIGHYKAKWNGIAWEESATQEYIDNLKTEPQEPTETERIEALEQALLEIVLGGVF